MALYRSESARKTAFESYDRVMEQWPVDYSERWVKTDYGESHVIISGPEDARPLFLIPGLFADATMWYANVGELSREYRVYCLDQITYGGKGRPSGKRVKDSGDYRHWFSQILDDFGYGRAAVGGLSYGSWLALALAREMPQRIASVVMLDPSETFIRMDGGIVWRGFWAFVFFPGRKKYRRFFDWMGGRFHSPESDIWLEHMLDVIEHGSVGMFDIPQHRIYRAEDLLMVTMPVLILAGGKPIVYKDPGALAAAAIRALPHARVEIIPETGHSLHVEKPAIVNGKILEFLSHTYKESICETSY